MAGNNNAFPGNVPDLGAIRFPQAYSNAISKCPLGCDPPMIMSAIPPPSRKQNGICRCIRCLTYWEVEPDGTIVNRVRGVDMSVDDAEKLSTILKTTDKK